MNLGKIDMAKLESLARSAGISQEELSKALAERGLNDIRFMTSFSLV